MSLLGSVFQNHAFTISFTASQIDISGMHTLSYSTTAAAKLLCQQPDDEMMLQLVLMSEFILFQVNKHSNKTFNIYFFHHFILFHQTHGKKVTICTHIPHLREREHMANVTVMNYDLKYKSTRD